MADLSLAKLPGTVKALGLGALFSLLIFVLFYVMVYSDISTKISRAQQDRIKLTDDLKAQQLAQATYLRDKEELVVRQQRQREMNKALPEQTEAASFLSAIQQVSNASGVDLKGWQPIEERRESYFAKVPMKLELSGKFHQITKFVYEIGRVDRIINIENLELVEPKLEGDEIRLKARCLATSFHGLPKPKAPEPGTPGGPK